MRIGHGYDVHALVAGRKLMMGGVHIPFDRGLLGHSDADVLTHAIMDALLGAAGLGDIGMHFPDNDPEFKDISSLLLLRKTAVLLTKEGLQTINVDATIIAQQPRFSPYIPEMRKNIALHLGMEPGYVNIKATTEEGLGFTGTGKGIAVHAVALLEKRR